MNDNLYTVVKICCDITATFDLQDERDQVVPRDLHVAIDALTKDQRRLFKQQLELLARYLKMDLQSGEKAIVG